MEISPNNSTCLELTIAIPGFSSSPSVPSSGESGGNATKELDINQVPLTTEEDQCMEEEVEDDHESPNGGPVPRKKLRLTKEQSRFLEESFKQNHTLNPKQKEGLAMQLNLKARQVEVWFQNRRARSKLKQTGVEFEYLKRTFGSLTEQNRRLQKEVEELKAIKVGPPDGSRPPPSSALTMCPCCQRVATASTINQLDKGSTTSTAATKSHFLQPQQPYTSCYN